MCCKQIEEWNLELEIVAIANALQLEAVRRHACPFLL